MPAKCRHPVVGFRVLGFELWPGQACRVCMNEVHPESYGFSFQSETAIWNNKGDCGYLYDGSGVEVGRYCY